jgi:hypothetical protein
LVLSPQVVKKMQVENNYDDRMLCIACQDSEREVMFLPCSHVGMCAGCAASVSECPTAVVESIPSAISGSFEMASSTFHSW